MALTRVYNSLPDYNRSEILRYAGVRHSDPRMEKLLDGAIEHARNVFTPKVCWESVDISKTGQNVNFGFTEVSSKGLARNLENCDRAIVFAATVGVGIDMLIRRAANVNMAEAVMLQALGGERVEALCRAFCADMAESYGAEGYFTRPRFSPGYGDLDIYMQRDIFRALDCQNSIGLYLADSMLLMPSKSVTAIIGLSREKCAPTPEGCAICDKKDCAFRKGRT